MNIAADEIQEGRFSRSTAANQSNNLPFVNVKIDIAQNRHDTLPTPFTNLESVSQIYRLNHRPCHLGTSLRALVSQRSMFKSIFNETNRILPNPGRRTVENGSNNNAASASTMITSNQEPAMTVQRCQPLDNRSTPTV